MTRLSYKKPRWRPLKSSAAKSSTALMSGQKTSAGKAVAVVSKAEAGQSRVQNRLENPQKYDRNLLDLLRRKRAQPSQLALRLRAERSKKLWWRSGLLAGVLSLGLGGTLWTALFLNGRVTYQGVPYQVIRKFLQDEPAKAAYFAGNKQALHYRLASLGIERDIKNYYRDRFDNEYELDRHIHQIMFDRTGYVGEAYQVNEYGRLVPKQRSPRAKKTF